VIMDAVIKDKRTVFFISDRTGITAETLGHSLLTQFDIDFEQVTLPFVDDAQRARKAIEQINRITMDGGPRPLIFSTVVQDDVRHMLKGANAAFFDFFDAFILPLESELGAKSSHAIGKSHGLGNPEVYDFRIAAMNYALKYDDGQVVRRYDKADIIIVGVSRTGKTPVSLYLAMQHGIFAANYPLTEEELMDGKLPKLLQPYRNKLYALTIQPERLHAIRQERKPNSKYASLAQCQVEIMRGETLYKREQIPCVNSTAISIEEIATTIIHTKNLKRRAH